MSRAGYSEEKQTAIDYARAIKDSLPLISPNNFAELLNRLSKEPEPSQFIEVMDDDLKQAWYEARTKRERYNAMLAEQILSRMPQTEQQRASAAKRMSEF